MLGSLLVVLGIILFIPLILSIYFQEGTIIYKSFLIPAVIALISGIIFSRLRVNNSQMDITTGMIICGMGWLLSSILGAVPYIIGLEKGFIDSLFEAVSGFTTTGITVFINLEQMPMSILFWRSTTQWLGGLGILTFFLLITFRTEGGIWKLFTAESHKVATSRPVPNIYKSIKLLWAIYIGFTLLEIILLIFCKVSLFDAIIHSFTTISTGGFSRYDSSISHFALVGNPYYILIEYIIIFFMIMGGINFLVHYKVVKGDIAELFTGVELKYFWSIIAGTLVIITAAHYYEVGGVNLSTLEETIRKTLFQVVSVMTTTGYQTEFIGSEFFPAVARQLFLVLMLIGGCVGSTGGGVKVVRVAILNKLFFREVNKFYLPKRAIMPVTLDKKIIPTDELMRVAAIFFAWIVLVIIGGGITAVYSDLSPWQSISGMLSAVSNIGPFYFSVDRMISLSPIIKITYIIGMLAGRLEILPVLILFTRRAWK